MNIFQKASANLPLTPGERAFLKLLQSLLMTAILAGLLAAGQYLTGIGSIDWQKFAFVVGGAAVLAVGHAVAKYFSAQADTQPLGNAIELVVDAIEQRFENRLNSATEKPVAASQMMTYPNVLTTTQQHSTTGSTAQTQGYVWTPLQGNDVTMQDTQSHPAFPPQQQ